MNITDIIGSQNININTPILVLYDVPRYYLIQGTTNKIDIEKLYNGMANKIYFLNVFIPVGQIIINDTDTSFNLILANTRIIPITSNYKKIDTDTWIGYIKKNGRINKSIGLYIGKEPPTCMIPVFPPEFLKQSTDQNIKIYKNIMSNKKYGRWILDEYQFNLDVSNLRMIDSMGMIGDMNIPNNTSTRIKKGKYVILTDRTNPWFMDVDRVGYRAYDVDADKITGIIETMNNVLVHDTPNTHNYYNNMIIITLIIIIIIILSCRK